MAIKFSNYEDVYTSVVSGLFTDTNVTYTVSDNHIKFSGIDENEQLLNWLGRYAFTYNVLVDITVSTGLLTKTYTKTRFRSFGGDEAVIVFGEEITKEKTFDEKLSYCYKSYNNKELTIEEFEDYKDVFDFLNADILFSVDGVRVYIPPYMSCNACTYLMKTCSPNRLCLDSCVRNTNKHINTDICGYYERGKQDKTCDSCKYQGDRGEMFHHCNKLNEEFYKTNCKDWEERV